MTEKGYQGYIKKLLEEQYDSVEQNVYLPQTRRYVDFIVEAGVVTLAIEVEHSSEAVVAEGYGQSQFYAKHHSKWVPVIIYPPDGENQEELAMVAQDVALVPIEHKHE